MSQLKHRRRAFARLMKRHEHAVRSELRACATQLARRDPASVEDLMQEGMIAIWSCAAQLWRYRDPMRTAVFFAQRRMRQWMGMRMTKDERELARSLRILERDSTSGRKTQVERQRRAMGDYNDDFNRGAA